MKHFFTGLLASLDYHKEGIVMFIVFLVIVGSLIYAYDASFR